MAERVRIGAGLAFYGDSPAGALAVAKAGDVQYIGFDHLSELTLAILQKDRLKDPNAGFARDILPIAKQFLPFVHESGIKLIHNAGGLNPRGAAEALLGVARKLGLRGLRVALVNGDDLHGRLAELRAAGVSLRNIETGADFDKALVDKLVFANAYLGAAPIIEALALGADVVLTGRVADASLFVGPIVHELGWSLADPQQVALATVAGHLLECAGQATGGNFSGDWWNVPALERIGYPIAELTRAGELLITKPPNTGGRVIPDTLKEQLYYEVHDPTAYLTPDGVVDLSRVRLEQQGPDRVRVSAMRGAPRPDSLKLLLGYHDGWMGQAMISYSWPDAERKAREAERIARAQLSAMRIEPLEIRAEYFGIDALHGPTAPRPAEPNEVLLRMAIKTASREEADRFPRIFPGAFGTNGPPFIGGTLGGIPRATPMMAQWPTLVPRELVEPHVTVEMLEA